MFSPVENYHFDDSKEHALLLGYRAVCKELYAKEQQKNHHIDLYELLKKEGEFNYSRSHERELQLSAINLSLKEITKLKERLEDNISKEKTDSINFLSIRTNDITEYMCCGAFIPELTFDSKRLKNLSSLKEIECHVSLNIFASDQDGVILFQWLGENSDIEEFLSSLLSKNEMQIPEFVTNLVFEFLENTFISPLWWNKLSTKQKRIIQKKVMVMGGHNQDCLITDNVGNIKWKINSITTNVSNLIKYNKALS